MSVKSLKIKNDMIQLNNFDSQFDDNEVIIKD